MNNGALSPEFENGLQILSKEGKKAKQRFVEANLRLVVIFARQFTGQGLEMLDLVQEGNIGLMHAVEMFDFTQGHKFSTYAKNWIKQSIMRAIANKGTQVRVAMHMWWQVRALQRVHDNIVHTTGVEPTDDHLAHVIGMAPETIASIQEAAQVARPPISLSAPMGDGDAKLEDFLVDSVAGEDDEMDARLIRQEALNALERAILTLPSLEGEMVRLRFGFDGAAPMTYEEIAKRYGLTREPVRRRVLRAMAKLAHPSRGLKPSNFL